MATVTGIVLAAGASERMGESKLLLPFRDSTVLNATIAAMEASAVDRVIVVTGANADEVEASLGKVASSSPSSPSPSSLSASSSSPFSSSPSGGGADEGGGGGRGDRQPPAASRQSPVASRQPGRSSPVPEEREEEQESRDGNPSMIVVRNPDYRRGNMSSLSTATTADPEAAAFVIVPGDMPAIRAGVIDRLIDLWVDQRPWAVVTRYSDRIAHPFLLSRTAVESMEGMTGEKVLGRILIESTDDRVVRLSVPRDAPRDVNTPEDYARLLEEL